MVDKLMAMGVHVYRANTHDIDNCGPLHVSGHASLEEYGDMVEMTKPKFFMPIYGPFRSKKYLIEEAIKRGVPRANCVNVGNGEIVALTQDKMEILGEVPHGTILVDETSAIVSNIVVKDRVLLSEEGLVAVILTVDKRTGNLLTSPDIISRGFIYMRDNEEIMNGLRTELRRATQQRFKRVDLDRFKIELKDHVTHYLFEQTQRSPIVIPVVNVIGSKGEVTTSSNGGSQTKSGEEIVAEQERRFQEMRARLLTQDPRVD